MIHDQANSFAFDEVEVICYEKIGPGDDLLRVGEESSLNEEEKQHQTQHSFWHWYSEKKCEIERDICLYPGLG
jgi:hypothetical protein